MKREQLEKRDKGAGMLLFFKNKQKTSLKI